jgi:hypothetical protein
MQEWICGRCFTRLTGDAAGQCPACGGDDVVPAQSPRGAMLVAQSTPPVYAPAPALPPPMAINPRHVVCPNCYVVDFPKTQGASSGAQIILVFLAIGIGLFVNWIIGLVLFVVLLIYTAASPTKKTCANCGANTVVPGNSPRAEELVNGRRGIHG